MHFLPTILFLLFAAPAFAQDKDKPKPNTLTPKEIADGWILLFDGETTVGWKIDGDAKVKDDVLVIGGGKSISKATLTTTFANYDAHLELEGPGELVFKEQKDDSSFGLANGTHTIILSGRSDPNGGGMLRKLTTGGGKTTESVTVTNRSPASLQITTLGNGAVKLRSAKLKPIGTKPLFNGKDLTGWKVFDDPKRAATKFEVTKDGELSAKNGPGDLQTEKAFDNFVLQLECMTNGKWLNSGIFFRCIPNQYQNGYECQIQNAFTGEDRTKPIDFGTGAIYRRIAARKVVSNDNEWFTLTVVADGKHFATWVNGYQTVDWTDDRPANDNPRQGYRAEKGHLSIQGHDPTTDLLFRNIRIVELPATK